MHWNSKEGLILTSALLMVTVLVTIFLQNSINSAIERKALSLGTKSEELKSFSEMVQDKGKKNTVTEPITQVKEPPISFTKKEIIEPPPVGSGKKWTPL